MTKVFHKLFLSIAIFAGACTLQTAQAEQVFSAASSSNQFVIQLPVVDREELTEQLLVLRSQLIQRKQALMDFIADNQMDSGDTLLMTIMPGGLLYAGYKKASSQQAKNELDNINADIDAFSSDLVAMRHGATPAVIARHQ